MNTKDKAGKVKGRPTRRRKQTESNPDVNVVYTQAKPFNRNRFLLRIATVIAVVLALLVGVSIFFKVDKVMVYPKTEETVGEIVEIDIAGSEKYSAWQIMEASGIQYGDNLMFVSAAKVAANITTKLPYVQQVRLEIALPDTVKIEVVEADVIYAIEDAAGSWWLIDRDGKVLEQTSRAETKDMTRVLGVQITGAEPGQIAVAAEPVPEETGEDGMTIPVTVHAADRLRAATSILRLLEENGILGEMDSVDVTQLSDIQLWLGERYQILLGDDARLDYKVAAMKQALDQSGDYQSGILDVSFTTWPDKVGYTPF